MRVYRNIYLSVLIFVFSVVVFCCTLFNFELGKVSNDDTLIPVTIEKGSVSDIAKTLKDKDLIKNELFFQIYVRLTGKTNLIAADYELSKNMGVRKIVDILSSKDGAKSTSVSITFPEGINMRKVATIIANNTNNTEEDVFNLLDDNSYINDLIDKYWFLTSDIEKEGIYYPLEGYLFPNTYSLKSKDVSVEEIFKILLDETSKQLNKYKSEIENNKLSVHEILTLASMVELEAVTDDDRNGVASVFLNRLSNDMSLGSDVTTYYAAKIDMGERDLYKSEISDCNDYNTRCSTFKKLPIGPISNPSISAIKAVIEPIDSDYYYFVADKDKKVYFSKTSAEQSNIIAKLKKEGKWYEY